MINAPRDIAKLLSLNVDLDYLLQRVDKNTPGRIFDAISKKLNDMNYCLVHKDDLREVQENEEPAPQAAPKKSLPNVLVPLESDES